MPPSRNPASFALVREPEGVLTFAFGPSRYKAQAVSLAQSIRLHNPGLRLACITDDESDSSLRAAFDILLPLVPERGKALQQKLWFDTYTPFERTAFIDSDCLVVGSLQEILQRSRGHTFAPLGYVATKGWWYMRIEDVLAKYRLPFMPRFNGGYYYFEKGDLAASLFARARQVGRVHARLGIYDLGLWFNEEVFYALAMAWERLAPVPDPDRTGMYTPDEFGFGQPLHIDVVEGYCRFEFKGETYRPVIAHFFGKHGSAFHYLRERKRLTQYLRGKSAWFRNLYAGASNLAFASLVGIYRIGLKLAGKPLPYKNNLPVVPVSNFGGNLTRRLFDSD